ncbi:armadillo repeat-containing protein 8 isoform X1 [Halyomorpha halys]|uniref:armadillo repeat-containing protein 8 isoform X1 n=1 Tax=Halyomorpha halys TaxID=286706 RepID=UPI0006D4DDEE|nr:armadillo repeat-containing protein 8 isoform X1 [Halyomorpha halys]XP_014290306.1 armadillo repeat-containing protein 8 isoform X1 [Halyomorpha halys]
MVSVAHPFMDVESCRSYIDELFSPDQRKCLEALVCLKNTVIGSNRQKGSVIAQGVVTRLTQLLQNVSIPTDIRVEAAVTLGSLAKGTESHVKQLIDFGIAPLLLNCILSNDDPKLTDVCLRCACSIFSHPQAPYGLIFQEQQTVSHLLKLAMQSVSNQICVTTILSASCKTLEHQMLLCDQGAIYTLAALLCSPHYSVLMPTLNCIANLAYQNANVSAIIATASFGGVSVPDLLVGLMSRDRPSEMQLASAKCLTYIHRAGAISAEDSKILYKTLPCLVVLCKKDHTCEERVVAAETIAYLTEVNTDLQRLASISNQLIPTLANMLHSQSEANNNNNVHLDPCVIADMKQAAFRAFASLGANDEDIRKRIIETERLMEEVVCGLEDPNDKVRLAAVRCLHSLSRSVQQLRTTFLDHSVWKPLMGVLQGASDDLLSVASSTLCNLLLEFSPAKEPILESGGVDLLCSLTHRPDPALRLNGVWALMNMAFQADQKVKSQILHKLGTEQIFRLLSDSEVNVLMKTLGLLRNLLSTKPHIDQIMALHGIQIMQAVTLILDSNHSADVKEQALCILGNIGDGDSAKEFIMSREDILNKIQEYMTHSNVKLQIAAIFCISNLVWKEESGAAERQAKLKEMGVYRLLQQLIMTSDTLLFDNEILKQKLIEISKDGVED